MSNIACNVNKLTLPEKIQRGQDIISASSGNPNVTGNAAAVADLVTAQTALSTAMAAYEAAKTACKEAMASREAAAAAWNAKVNALAGVTEALTDGDEAKILSAGFDVRAPRTPSQPLGAPTNARATTNGEPGYTTVSCDPLAGAKSYVVQKSNDPTAEEGWVTVATPTKATCDTNGVTPGTRAWYRMAGVNARGRGLWSEPTPRPVM
jgi:hypothetical protein